MLHEKTQKNANKYFCQKCDFSCSNKYDFNRHCKTIKHNAIKCYTDATPKNVNFICSCGRQYKHASSYYRHTKLCKIADNSIDEVKTTHEDYDTNGIMHILKQNEEFKELLIEQNKLMVNQQTENQTLQKQLIEAVKVSNVTNNNIINNNNNQKFNLNFFLNTTCKDAMNMSEFIENINIDLHELEDIGRQGYVTGMTNMILSRIKDMDVTKRPLHCTDLKRETMYIKENDEWSKETPDNIRLRNMIKIVGNNNMTALPAWREKHPECQISEHPQYEFCIDMMRNILGDVGEEQRKLENKVIKNLSRHLLVNKGL